MNIQQHAFYASIAFCSAFFSLLFALSFQCIRGMLIMNGSLVLQNAISTLFFFAFYLLFSEQSDTFFALSSGAFNEIFSRHFAAILRDFLSLLSLVCAKLLSLDDVRKTLNLSLINYPLSTLGNL